MVDVNVVDNHGTTGCEYVYTKSAIVWLSNAVLNRNVLNWMNMNDPIKAERLATVFIAWNYERDSMSSIWSRAAHNVVSSGPVTVTSINVENVPSSSDEKISINEGRVM